MKKFLRIIYQPYKWIIFLPALALSTLLLGSLAVILVFIMNPKTAGFLSGVTWARFNAFLTPMFIKVIGRENIDKKRSYVIVSNHQSHFDILVIYGWLGVDFKWVMKQELRKVPALGIACERLGHIFVDRSNHASAITTLKNAKTRITGGTSVMFFPEGTRSKDGNLGDFKKGAFKMALDLGLPILPVTIVGTKNILPAGTLNLFPGRAKLIIQKPVETGGYNDDSLTDLMKTARDVIVSGLGD